MLYLILIHNFINAKIVPFIVLVIKLFFPCYVVFYEYYVSVNLGNIFDKKYFLE
jgi:hypothetical protein